jgi:hypothetical protein
MKAWFVLTMIFCIFAYVASKAVQWHFLSNYHGIQ